MNSMSAPKAADQLEPPPKTWKDCQGRRQHLLSVCENPEGQQIVVSRTWARRRQRWEYHAATLQWIWVEISIVKMRESECGEGQ